MSIPQNVIVKFKQSLNDTLTYYTSMPGDHSKEIAAIQRAIVYGIGKPESSEGVSLAVQYKQTLNEKLKKATRPVSNSGSNQNALTRRRAQLATRKANANRANANRANTRKTRVGSPLAANARRQLNGKLLHNANALKSLRNEGSHY